mgnify:CR=1 FL=1
MNTTNSEAASYVFNTWTSGGWLMLPLLLLTFFIYYNALELFCRVQFHFLVRSRLHARRPQDLAQDQCPNLRKARQLLIRDARSMAEVKRHFHEVRNEYIPIINRRIRFLGIIITAGPLLGLLGTVSGMFSTFQGMVQSDGNRFENVVTGISEALITTQTGLIISIPALVLLSLIIQRRNTLVHALARLERYNAQLALRAGCPIQPRRQAHRQQRIA